MLAIVDNATILDIYGGDSLHLMLPYSARTEVEGPESASYVANIDGRKVIDYDKLKSENPELYYKILKAEHEADAQGVLDPKDL